MKTRVKQIEDLGLLLEDKIIRGMSAYMSPVPNGLTLNIEEGVYQADGRIIQFATNTVILSNGDITYDRIDLVYADSTNPGIPKVKEGTPSTNPVSPTLIDNEVLITEVLISTGATGASPGNSGIITDSQYAVIVVKTATFQESLPASTYNNGTGGVGATLTANSNGALSAQSGYTLLLNERLLVRNQTSQFSNPRNRSQTQPAS